MSYDNLLNRGFVKQCSDEEALRKFFATERVAFYAGFDATADSLHIGSLVPIMAMANLQRDGHKAICLIGGATTLIGDPSGKTEMRKMLSVEDIDANSRGVLGQMQRFLNLDGEAGMHVNNADWCRNLNYIDFLRDIGKHFKVNEMIRMESYRVRLERQEGLSFIEFNYQLLQAYDFLVLNDRHGCALQIGGDDQWGNIVAGIGLIRQARRKEAYALTFPLLETASGKKMGKTESGAVWLDAAKTTPFDFFQYWINTDDRDVLKFLKLFTFLSLAEIAKFERLEGSDLKPAKETLAFEVTKLVHGLDAATAAKSAANALFYKDRQGSDTVPGIELEERMLATGIGIADLLVRAGLASSKSEARRLVKQGGAYLNDERVASETRLVTLQDLRDGSMLLRQGKKNYRKISTTAKKGDGL